MKYWACLHGEKDAEDLHAGADGLLRLASATNLGSPTAPGGSGQTQRPLQIRDTNVEVAANDMELEEQE
jgi:hypothetical protein